MNDILNLLAIPMEYYFKDINYNRFCNNNVRVTFLPEPGPVYEPWTCFLNKLANKYTIQIKVSGQLMQHLIFNYHICFPC